MRSLEFRDAVWAAEPTLWSVPREPGPRTGAYRVGGPNDLGGLNPERVAAIAGLRAERGPPPVRPAPPRWDWEEQRMSALLSAHAQSTRRQYSSGWARWVLFCEDRPLRSPFLTREGDASALNKEDNLLLDFAV